MLILTPSSSLGPAFWYIVLPFMLILTPSSSLGPVGTFGALGATRLINISKHSWTDFALLPKLETLNKVLKGGQRSSSALYCGEFNLEILIYIYFAK